MGHHDGVTGSQAPSSTIVETVRRVRSGDPLSRITVIVPSFGAVRDLVRALALSGGAANVAVRTATQVVAELSGPALAPRAPLPFPLLAAAVEKALDSDPGRLKAVATEPITGQAVAQACQRLGTVEPESVSPENPLQTEVLRLARDAHAQTGSRHYTQFEAVSTAIDRLELLGRVIVAAPLRGSALERRLRTALDAHGVDTVPGTGSDHLASAAEPDSERAVTGTHVVHASDSDDEVRAVVRFVRSRLAEGVPGHRIGVYYPSPDPYQRLLHRAFAEAGIEIYGPTDSGVGRSAAGRSLIRLLQLDAELMPRAEVLSIVAEGAVVPTDDGGKSVSSRRAELLTRTRFPVIGGADWDRMRDALREEPESFSERDQQAGVALLHLITRIRDGLATIDAATTWTQTSDAIGGMVTALFRQSPDRAAVSSVVAALADLDSIAPAITRDRVVGAVSARLDKITDRVGAEGAGVPVGPIDAAVGRDLDTVCIVGMSEGLLPVLHRPDPLLPEGAVGPDPSEQLDERYRVLQLALAAGHSHRLCSFPRGSMRGGGDRIPSRWLLPTLSRLAGVNVHATRWQQDVSGSPAVTAVPSFVDGILTPPTVLGSDPATAAELRIRELAAADWKVTARAPALLARAHQLRGDRRFGRFTRFTGDVSAAADLLTVLERPLSPTRLEDWAQSPYLFFIGTILRVRALDDPADEIEMDVRDYGELIHRILQRYIDARLAAGSGPDHDLLMSALKTECDAAVAASPGMVASLWRRREMLLGAELIQWFEADSSDAGQGWRPLATELGFGRADRDGAVLTIPYEVATSHGTSSLLLAGSIDRVDTRSGSLRVTDYKTGRAPDTDNQPTSDNPTSTGTRFQLPLYAAAAATAHDLPVSEARYWYCTEKGEFTQIGLEITDAVMDRVREDVGHLVDALQSGWFPLKGGRGSSRDLANILGNTDLDEAWAELSREEPLSTHPAFTGLLLTDQSENDAESRS